jgi:hypothetical protein
MYNESAPIQVPSRTRAVRRPKERMKTTLCFAGVSGLVLRALLVFAATWPVITRADTGVGNPAVSTVTSAAIVQNVAGSTVTNGATRFRVMVRDLDSTPVTVTINLRAPNGAVTPLPGFTCNGADSRDFDLGNGASGVYLTQLGTYQIEVTASDGGPSVGTGSTTVITQASVTRRAYYIDSASGNDSLDGLSEATAWRNISKIAPTLQGHGVNAPGTTFYLKCNSVWTDQPLEIATGGTRENRVVIKSYGSGLPPRLQRSPIPVDKYYDIATDYIDDGVPYFVPWDQTPNGMKFYKLLQIQNAQYITLEDIDFSTAVTGIYLRDNYQGVEITRCRFYDMNYLGHSRLLPDNPYYGAGYAAFYGAAILGEPNGAFNGNWLGVNDCTFDHCFNDIRLIGVSSLYFSSSRCRSDYSGSGTFSFTDVRHSVIKDWIISDVGINDKPGAGQPNGSGGTRPTFQQLGVPGPAGIYFQGVGDISVLGCRIQRTRHYEWQSDGSAIAIETGTGLRATYILIDNCIIEENEGPAVSWLGSAVAVNTVVRNCRMVRNNLKDNSWTQPPPGHPNPAAYKQEMRTYFSTTFSTFHPISSGSSGAFINNTDCPSSNTAGLFSAFRPNSEGGWGFRWAADAYTVTGDHMCPSTPPTSPAPPTPPPAPPPTNPPPSTPPPCPSGQIRDASGQCVWEPCPSGQVRDSAGQCVLPPCPSGQVRDGSGNCVWPACPTGQVRDDNGMCVWQPCPEGQVRDDAGQCVLAPCPTGMIRAADGSCVTPCPSGTQMGDNGSCQVICFDGSLADSEANCPCPEGYFRDASGGCSVICTVPCWDGSMPDANGNCPPGPEPCWDGSMPDSNGNCPQRPQPCWDGSMPDANGNCPQQPQACWDGSMPDNDGNCPPQIQPCWDGSMPDDQGNCPSQPTCWDGSSPDGDGNCPPQPQPCEDGSMPDQDGNCPPGPQPCWDGSMPDENGNCPSEPQPCWDGSMPDESGNCPSEPSPCWDGSMPDSDGNCPSQGGGCWDGSSPDEWGNCPE